MSPLPPWDKDHFLRFIESLPDAYLLLDPELIILAASKVYLEASLSRREEIIGKHIFEAFPDNPALPDGDGVPNLRNSLMHVLHYKKVHKMPVQRYDIKSSEAEGFEKKYWSPVNSPVLDTDGNVQMIIHKVEDVTHLVESREKKEALNMDTQLLLDRAKNAHKEAELQRNLLLNTFKQAPVAISIFKGPAYFVELVNEHMCRFWRTEAGELEGRPLFEAKPELIEQGTKERLDYVLETGEPYIGKNIAVRLPGRDGTVYFNVVNYPMKDLDGQTIGVIAMAVEVTEEIKALQEVEQSKNRFRNLANAIPHIVWTAGESGLIEYINDRWGQYTGLDKQESQGWGWIKAVHPNHQQKVKEAWQNAVESSDHFNYEYKVRDGDGGYRWHRANAVKIQETGGVLKWYGTLTDINEQKQVLERLEKVGRELKSKNDVLHRVNSELDSFVYTASHDLKSPLNNLEGLFKLLLEGVKKGEDTAGLESMIGLSFNRFKNTLRDLADIVNVDRMAPMDIEAISFAAMLEETMQNLQSQIIDAGAAIDSDFQVEGIRFSRKNLRSLFYNIISNSLKYRHPDRKPHIFVQSSKGSAGEVVLTIADNGLGMDSSKKEKIFGMFTRLHKHVEGSGIGLYIIKKMIDNAGGRLEVESKPDVGSTFTIVFPQKPAATFPL